jgi:hypothetical protein
MSAMTIQQSPFEVIRGNRADGSGFWSGQELIQLLSRFKFIPLDRNRILQLENFVSLRDTLAVRSEQIVLERDAGKGSLDHIFLGFRQFNIKKNAA